MHCFCILSNKLYLKQETSFYYNINSKTFCRMLVSFEFCRFWSHNLKAMVKDKAITVTKFLRIKWGSVRCSRSKVTKVVNQIVESTLWCFIRVSSNFSLKYVIHAWIFPETSSTKVLQPKQFSRKSWNSRKNDDSRFLTSMSKTSQRRAHVNSLHQVLTSPNAKLVKSCHLTKLLRRKFQIWKVLNLLHLN